MKKEQTYNCLPQLNKKCGKDNCFWNGGECYSTTIKKYSLVGLLEENKQLHSIIKEAREYIEKDTRWFDWEYARTYGELCSCKGANSNRLEVLVNPSNLLEILNKAEENK